MGDVGNEPPTVLLADADMLTDYRESDLSVLKEVGRRIGRLAVLSEVLETPSNQCDGCGLVCAIAGRHSSCSSPRYSR